MAGLGRPGLSPGVLGSWLTTQLLEEVRGGSSSLAWGWRSEGLGVFDVFLFFFFLDHVQFSQRNLQRLELFYLSLAHVNNFQINIVLNK